MLFTFNIPDKEKDIINYLNNFKNNGRNFSLKMKSIIEECMKKENNSLNIKKQIKDIEINSKEEIKKLRKKIKESEENYKKIFEETINKLKSHYMGKSKLIDVDEFIQNKSYKLSMLSGEKFENIQNKIVNEITKLKKE